MQIVLLVAGGICLFLPGQFAAGILLLALTLFNAALGLNQEGKAEASVAALQKMLIRKTKVRRAGALSEVDVAELVPGDIVAVEAGDVVPADGRLISAAALEIDESAATSSRRCSSRRSRSPSRRYRQVCRQWQPRFWLGALRRSLRRARS